MSKTYRRSATRGNSTFDSTAPGPSSRRTHAPPFTTSVLSKDEPRSIDMAHAYGHLMMEHAREVLRRV